MATLSARIDDKLDERIVKVTKVYGGSRTSVLENALEYWLSHFEDAKDSRRLEMIVRPKGPRTRSVAA